MSDTLPESETTEPTVAETGAVKENPVSEKKKAAKKTAVKKTAAKKGSQKTKTSAAAPKTDATKKTKPKKEAKSAEGKKSIDAGYSDTPAGLMKRLIMEGKKTDAEIWAAVQTTYKGRFEDSQRGYVNWCRHSLIKKGANPPGPVGGLTVGGRKPHADAKEPAKRSAKK